MISPQLAAVSSLLLLTHALVSRAAEGPGYLHFPLTARTGPSPSDERTKRQVNAVADEEVSGSWYTLDLTFGTPGQTVPVQFDTGAQELWVNPVCANASMQNYCVTQPRFTESSSLVDTGELGEIEYAVGWAKFRYMTDSVSIGSAKISKQKFGAAYESKRLNTGIFGAAPAFNKDWKNEYPSVIDNLKTQGEIASRSFGMDLRRHGEGSVTFGGLDTRKFSGRLQELPVVPGKDTPGDATRWWIHLDGITVTHSKDDSTTTVYEAPSGKGEVMHLDSGFTLCAFPPKIFRKLLAAFPGAKKRADGRYEVPCESKDKSGLVSFKFRDLTVHVRQEDFVWTDVAHGNEVVVGSETCVLGAFERERAVLGDTFLRGAYVVYNFDKRTVHIAQSANCGSNIVAIGADGVPVKEGDCDNGRVWKG